MPGLTVFGSKASGITKVSAVATSETTTSASFADLATVDTITLVVPANALCEFFVDCTLQCSGGGTAAVAIFDDVENAATQVMSSASATAVRQGTRAVSNNGTLASWALLSNLGSLAYPLTAGTHNLKLQYKASAGTATFSARKLWVVCYTP